MNYYVYTWFWNGQSWQIDLKGTGHAEFIPWSNAPAPYIQQRWYKWVSSTWGTNSGSWAYAGTTKNYG